MVARVEGLRVWRVVYAISSVTNQREPGWSRWLTLLVLLVLLVAVPGCVQEVDTAATTSPYICGTNMHSELANDLSATRQVGVTTIRFGPGPGYSQNLVAVMNSGFQPMIILHGCEVTDPTQRLAADQKMVAEAQQVFGADARVFYEVGNENDLTCLPPTDPPGKAMSSAQYTAMWNSLVPQLKQLAPNAWFGGPVMSYPHPEYIAAFVHSANPKPDFISWHEYPCRSNSTRAECMQNTLSWRTQIDDLKKSLSANDDALPPMMVTEWNYAPDEGVPGDDKHSDPVFMHDWTVTALRTLIDDGVYAAYQFNVYVTPLIGSAQGRAFQDICQQIIDSSGGTNSSVAPSGLVFPTAIPSPKPPRGTLGGVLAEDTFRRPDRSSWGAASDAQLWGGDANANPAFSIRDNLGRVANGNSAYDAILGPVASDAQVLFAGSMSSFLNSNIGAVLRWTDTNNWYKAYIDGTNLVVQKRVNGTYSILARTPFDAAPDTSYSLRFQAVGTIISAKAWSTAVQEPPNWMVTVPDETFSSGRFGLRMQVQAGITATFSSFVAHRVYRDENLSPASSQSSGGPGG